MGGANAQAVYTSEQQPSAASSHVLQRSTQPPIWIHVFIDGSQTLSTLGVKYAKNKQVTGFHASGSQKTEDLNWKHKWLWGNSI